MTFAKVMDFDGIFESIGSFGTYQILMFMVLSICSFTGTDLIYTNFLSYVPDHWCHIDELEDLPHDVQKNVASPMKTDSLGNAVIDSCSYYNLNYSLYTDEDFLNWNRTVNIPNDTITAHCQNGWVYGQSVVLNSIVTKWDLVCGQAFKVQLLLTITLFGIIPGSIIVGPLSDRFGRRICLAFFSFLKIAATFLSALSPIYPLTVLAYVFIVIGSNGIYVLSFATMIEIVGPAMRSPVGMVFSVMYSLGFMCTAVYGYFIRDETKLQFLRAGINTCLLLACWFCPESPRWLLLNDRKEEAEKTLKKIAIVNGQELPKSFDINSIKVKNEEKSKANILHVFKSPIMRKRALILCLHWFTDSLIFFALSLNTAALSGDVYLNTFLSGAIEIPANLAAIWLMKWKRVGRRGTAFFSLALAGVSCLICIPLILTQAAPAALTAFSLLGKGGATMGYNIIFVYTSELFPTDVRDTGISICNFAARVSGMLSTFIGVPLAEVWAPLPNIIFGSLSIVSAFLSLLLPETLGVPLPDSIEMAEEQARQKKEKISMKCLESPREKNIAANEDISMHL